MLPRLRIALAFALLALAALYACAASAGAVDVNRASLTELMHLPGMTEIWARRIVHFRPYHSKLDLLNQGVVSQQVYARIRDSIVAHRVNDSH